MRARNLAHWTVYSLVGAALIGATVYLLGGGFFSWISICRICGARRESMKVLWMFPVHKLQPTPLSNFVADERIQMEHRHAWLFGAGSGAGVKCAIGPGRHLFGITDDAEVQRFLAAVKQYRGIEEARVWLKATLDPQTAHDVRSCFSPSPGEVKDRQVFDQWFNEESSIWAQYERARKIQN